MMTALASIKQILTQLKPELEQKYFVNSMGLFGSIVREDFNATSDVDIIVDFSRPIGIEFIGLADYLESKLHKKMTLFQEMGLSLNIFIK